MQLSRSKKNLCDSSHLREILGWKKIDAAYTTVIVVFPVDLLNL